MGPTSHQRNHGPGLLRGAKAGQVPSNPRGVGTHPSGQPFRSGLAGAGATALLRSHSRRPRGQDGGGLTSPHPGLAGSCKGLVPHHAATISWPLRGGLQGAAALTPPTRANQAWVSSLTLSSTLSTPSGWTASCMCPETQAPLLRQTCRRGPRRAARAHSFNHVFPCVRTDRRKTHVSRPQRPSPASCSLQFKR